MIKILRKLLFRITLTYQINVHHQINVHKPKLYKANKSAVSLQALQADVFSLVILIMKIEIFRKF